jgi:hypothetical protein
VECYLAMQKTKSLNDKNSLLEILLQVGPYLGIGLAAQTLGFRLAHFIPSDGRSIVQAALWILIVVMILLANEPFWNNVLFLVFSLGAGMTLYWLSTGSLHPRTWYLLPILFIISAVGGDFIQGSASKMNRVLITGMLLFLLGWVLLQIIPLTDLVRKIWILSGLALFSATIMVIISLGKDQNNGDSAISRSIQLSVALFNLCWLANIL